ncbi:MAG: hypothetical protein H0W78_09765 [Planctomycetes bacterium]|jgi:hypothetical protein|nr:hypothetical protein [Planctomycetota bacterium]
MYTKAAFLKSIALEAKIIKHLVTQIPTGQADWRMTPPQRSTIELIRFLSFMPYASVEFALTQGWDKWEGHETRAKDLQSADFPKAMDKQIKGITKLLAKLNDGALKRKTTKHWNGTKMTLGDALVAMVLSTMVAYRMQLFLQVKASGAPQLTSSDCWQGKAAKAKPASA